VRRRANATRSVIWYSVVSATKASAHAWQGTLGQTAKLESKPLEDSEKLLSLSNTSQSRLPIKPKLLPNHLLLFNLRSKTQLSWVLKACAHIPVVPMVFACATNATAHLDTPDQVARRRSLNHLPFHWLLILPPPLPQTTYLTHFWLLFPSLVV
jgi:hypothetical protein